MEVGRQCTEVFDRRDSAWDWSRKWLLKICYRGRKRRLTLMTGEYCWYEIGTEVFWPPPGPLFSGVWR